MAPRGPRSDDPGDAPSEGEYVLPIDVLPFPRVSALDASLMQFAIQLALCNGNVPTASRAVGWSPDKGRRLVRDNPQILEIADQAKDLASKHVLRRWVDMHADAMDTIDTLMKKSEDDRVRLNAALSVVERVEGKVPQKVEVDETDIRDVLASVTMRFVAALVNARGVPYAEAMLVAEKNPEKVEEWGRKHGLLTAGSPA